MRNQLSGVVVLDKPADLSSARAVAKVKRLLGVRKIGHTGTLDPFATGVLVCCINRATRLARFLLHGNKTYEAVLRLGTETDTLDATGRITRQTTVPELPADRVIRIIKGFVGDQMQRPPVYAALKHEGVPLYRLAREGKPLRKPARPITIAAIDVSEVNLPDIHFRVSCSSGTYVRSLCADMGAAIGCGGHLLRLRRTVNSGFSIEQAHTLEGLGSMAPERRLDRTLIPMVTALGQMPTFIAGPEILTHLTHGRPLTQDEVPAASIQRSADTTLGDHVKVVDGEFNLRAVLKRSPSGTNYDYCCVFH